MQIDFQIHLNFLEIFKKMTKDHVYENRIIDIFLSKKYKTFHSLNLTDGPERIIKCKSDHIVWYNDN